LKGEEGMRRKAFLVCVFGFFGDQEVARDKGKLVSMFVSGTSRRRGLGKGISCESPRNRSRESDSFSSAYILDGFSVRVLGGTRRWIERYSLTLVPSIT
jgi:hypothetical protein